MAVIGAMALSECKNIIIMRAQIFVNKQNCYKQPARDL